MQLVMDLRVWALATVAFLFAMAGFIVGIKLTNREHRKAANRRPYVPPAPVATATRITEPRPAPATVVHVHLPAMAPIWQTPVLNGQTIPALVAGDDTP